MLQHLTEAKQFSTAQHSFQPGYNCETALATLCHLISDFMDSRARTDVVQLYFSSAFDTLYHRILLYKVARAETASQLLTWLSPFLSNHRLCIVYQGAYSR